jgi:hypothetical protein
LDQNCEYQGALPKILVQVGVRDFLQGLHIVNRDEVTVKVHELDAHLLEGPLGEEVTLDPGNNQLYLTEVTGLREYRSY